MFLARPQACYLICATPRTGSTLLCETLRSLDMAGNPKEMKEWIENVDDSLLRRLYREFASSNGIWGCKFMWDSFWQLMKMLQKRFAYKKLTDAALLNLILPKLKIIRISRNDKVAQAVSLSIANQTRQWLLRKNEENLNILAQYSERKIDQNLWHIICMERQWESFIEGMANPCLHLTYEQLSRQYHDSIRRVTQFLGLPVEPKIIGKGRMIIQRDNHSEEWIEKYLAKKRKFYLKTAGPPKSLVE